MTLKGEGNPTVVKYHQDAKKAVADIECPRCGAEAGRMCRTQKYRESRPFKGKIIPCAHRERVNAWKDGNGKEPKAARASRPKAETLKRPVEVVLPEDLPSFSMSRSHRGAMVAVIFKGKTICEVECEKPGDLQVKIKG